MGGFHAIADDPDYLVELSRAPRPRSEPQPPSLAASASRPIFRRIELSRRSSGSDVSRQRGILRVVRPQPAARAAPTPEHPAPAPPLTPVRNSASPPPMIADLAEVIQRHAGQLGDDPHGFLPCLRRGESVPPAEVAELAQALTDLERESRDDPDGANADLLAPPAGLRVADPRTPTPGRARSTSGRSTWSAPCKRPSSASSRARHPLLSDARLRDHAGDSALTPNWPDTATGGRLGDGRYAHATDRPRRSTHSADASSTASPKGTRSIPKAAAPPSITAARPALPGVAIDTRASTA